MESLNEYMTRTFLWMVLGLMITFGLAVLGWMTNATLWLLYHVPGFHLIVLVVTLIMAFTMVSRIERMSVGAARGVFLAYSVLFGFTMSCYLYLYELPSLIFVFLATAVYFAALSAYGWLTHRDLSRQHRQHPDGGADLPHHLRHHPAVCPRPGHAGPPGVHHGHRHLPGLHRL